MLRTRFAPSPTGYLHVGNAYSALMCQAWAGKHHARLLLRMEDIDTARCRDEYARAIMEDLRWLGIRWQGEVRYQSRHAADYRRALESLRQMDVIYPCFCTRREIAEEIRIAGLAPHADDGMPPYAGTCRALSAEARLQRINAGQPFAWRLDVGKALRQCGPVSWRDGEGRAHAVDAGMHDAVIGRKDIDFSYHLAVVTDDAAQGITHVIRGEDLRASTGLHRLLQSLLGLPSPAYIHHPLLRRADGERLAKRNGAPSLRDLRTNGVSADTLRRLLMDASSHAPPVWEDVMAAMRMSAKKGEGDET